MRSGAEVSTWGDNGYIFYENAEHDGWSLSYEVMNVSPVKMDAYINDYMSGVIYTSSVAE